MNDNNMKPNEESLTKTLSKETVHRLMKDVRELMKHPLHDHGIYYCHDEEDLLKGYAMIIGPSGTPYFGGYYYFQFDYPVDYPFSPPVVTYCTNGENIRFNPNLYKTGKVCISLLNTWTGEQWSSCQTVTTILLHLCSLLNEEPLLNEPGVTPKHEDCPKYKKIVAFKNVDIAILKMMKKTKSFYLHQFDVFDTNLKQDIFLKHADTILQDLETKRHLPMEQVITKHYGMAVLLDYERLCKEFEDFTNELKRQNKTNIQTNDVEDVPLPTKITKNHKKIEKKKK